MEQRIAAWRHWVLEPRSPVGIGQLAVLEGRCVATAGAHLRRKQLDVAAVLGFEAELLTCEVPVAAVAGAGCLDVGGLAAGLPAAGDDDREVDGGALLAVTCWA
jgi:hypothetical protein